MGSQRLGPNQPWVFAGGGGSTVGAGRPPAPAGRGGPAGRSGRGLGPAGRPGRDRPAGGSKGALPGPPDGPSFRIPARPGVPPRSRFISRITSLAITHSGGRPRGGGPGRSRGEMMRQTRVRLSAGPALISSRKIPTGPRPQPPAARPASGNPPAGGRPARLQKAGRWARVAAQPDGFHLWLFRKSPFWG